MYVTAEDIDAQLGAEWATGSDRNRYTNIVNAWLAGVLKRQFQGVVPDAVKVAAGLVAPQAVSGKLFSATEKEVTSKSVEASGVKSSKSYVAGSLARTADENAAIGLLAPYINQGMTFAKLRKY